MSNTNDMPSDAEYQRCVGQPSNERLSAATEGWRLGSSFNFDPAPEADKMRNEAYLALHGDHQAQAALEKDFENLSHYRILQLPVLDLLTKPDDSRILPVAEVKLEGENTTLHVGAVTFHKGCLDNSATFESIMPKGFDVPSK